MTGIARQLLDMAPLAVFWMREDGRFAYVNETASAALGYPKQELLQLSIFDIDPDVTREMWRSHWSDVSEATSTVVERSIRRKDGSLMPVEVDFRQVVIDNQALHVSFVRDLTKTLRIKAEQEDHLSYLDALFHKSPVPQLIIDPATGSILDSNPAASSFYGFETEQLCRMNIDQINRMSGEKIRKEMQRARAGKKRFFQFQHSDAKNQLHDVKVFSAPVLRNGKQVLHSTILDVTDIFESRRRLLHQKELLDRLPIGVYQATAGQDGVIVQANPAFRAIFEVDADSEIIGRRMADLYANPEERNEVSERVLKTGRIFRHVREARTDQGRLIQMAITTQASRLPNGEIVLEGAVEDVTKLHEAEAEMRRANRRTANALKAAPIPMLIYTADGKIEVVNDEWCRLSGYSPEQLTTLDEWTNLAYGSDAAAVRAEINRMIRTGTVQSEGDFEVQCANGEKRTWAFYSGPLEFDGDKPSLVLSAAMDVTQQRNHERRMQQSDAIVESAYEGIAITDSKANIQRVNSAFARITGYSEDEVRGKNPRILSSGRQSKKFYESMWSCISQFGHWKGELWNRRKNGEIYPEWLSITEIRDHQGRLTNYVGVFNDLTELKQSQDDLDRVKRFDSLTGLPNRTALLQLLKTVISDSPLRSRRIAVLVCGLDRFRLINESFSYLEGDRLLRIIADRLKRNLGPQESIARLGGDQFAVVMTRGAGRREVLETVDRITETVSQPLNGSSGRQLSVHCSVGIARFPADGKQAHEILRNAETAMRQCKRDGPGSYAFYSSNQTAKVQEDLSIETRMRQALDERAFLFHLQPVVSVLEGRIIGAEVLARWPANAEEHITPDAFISIAEKTGLISPLSFQLLESACRYIAETRKDFDPSFRIAFNVSPLLLKDRHFDKNLLRCLEKYGLTPDQLEIELTESSLMQQVGGPFRLLKRLRKSGIRISIDDFGTGFSSLAYLQEIDAQVLKIDQRFISKLARNRADAKIAESIIAMAHALDMDTIAEGVETPEQLEFLRRQGCDFYQGFLFSKPLPPDDFEKLYQSKM